ncbi:MAG TPA: hypothetical protein VM694_43445, partial [Polyangium sp.]|nr:hypothetical protein [Polyangium sp.]
MSGLDKRSGRPAPRRTDCAAAHVWRLLDHDPPRGAARTRLVTVLLCFSAEDPMNTKNPTVSDYMTRSPHSIG